MLAGGGVAAAVIGALVWLTENAPKRVRSVVSTALYPLRAAGAMPVTLYTAQVLAIAAWIHTPAGDGPFLSWQSVPLFVTLLVASLLFASLWLAVFTQGPLEWLIARLARQRPWRSKPKPGANPNPDPNSKPGPDTLTPGVETPRS